MTDHKRIDDVTGTATSGHEWDGIEELDTPMPRWWLWSLYASIVWAIGYVILYPAWPMVNSATEGVLGWTSRGQLEAEMRADAQRRAPVVSAIAATAITDLQIGRATCRERVCQSVSISGVAGSLKQKSHTHTNTSTTYTTPLKLT